MNMNYRRGRGKEYREMKKLRDEGYDIVLRTAGSHGAFDIIAIKLIEQEVKFVQCKPSSMSENAKMKLVRKWYLLNGKFEAKFEVR